MQKAHQTISIYEPVLHKCPLFTGFSPGEIQAALQCFQGQIRRYGPNQILFAQGEALRKIGVVLEGYLDVVQEDFWGAQRLLGRIYATRTFGETFVTATPSQLPYTLLAGKPAVVILFDYESMMRPCPRLCGMHGRLTRNMLTIAANKAVFLLDRIHTLTQPSAREKIRMYLSLCAKRAHSTRFTLLMNRESLARYLAMDRSTLSAELSKMQKEGLIAYHKNTFTLREKAIEGYVEIEQALR